ncbi:MAG: superoxide dismutase family protein [Acidobacteriota bacterium]
MKTRTCLAVAAAMVLLASCSSQPPEIAEAAAAPQTRSNGAPAGTHTARATLKALHDSGVTGTVTFTSTPEGVRVEAHVNGLTPGSHGFHIHEIGDCSSPDGKSAGGHFNPMGVDHAGPNAAQAHAGDLGNIEANANGHGMLNRVSSRISLGGNTTNILSRAVIIHAKADDLTSQPTGAAGGRVACGVIEPID